MAQMQRRKRGSGVGNVQVSYSIPQHSKDKLQGAAQAMGVSAARCLELVLNHLELESDGLPAWADRTQNLESSNEDRNTDPKGRGLLATVGRLVVEAREERGWSHLDLLQYFDLNQAPETFIESLRRLEDGIAWLPMQEMEQIEDALGWWVGITRDLRFNSSDLDPNTLTLDLVKEWKEVDWGNGSRRGEGGASLPLASALLRELTDRVNRLEIEIQSRSAPARP